VVRADPKPFKALPAGMLKNDRHDQLMEEFRRVHRKMFSTFTSDDNESEKEKEEERKMEIPKVEKKAERKESFETIIAKTENNKPPTPAGSKQLFILKL
jgi:hypothetical protein